MPLSLECWGKEWAWNDCKDIVVPELPFYKIILTPHSHNAVRLKLAPTDIGGHSEGGILKPSYEARPRGGELTSDRLENATMEEKYAEDQMRVTYTHLGDDEALIVNDVQPHQIYRITLAPHKQGNASTIFFRINDTSSEPPLSRTNARIIDADFLVKAEEISLVVLILILWMVAIALFVHRWGKIRMLEPYQPDYKANHEPNCPLNPSTSPTLVTQQSITSPRLRAPTLKSLPRKSSSLCFTPSMLRTTVPKHCPIQKRCAFHRRRGRLSTDYGAQKFVHVSELCRKARSAENLRHTKITISPDRSMDDGDETGKSGDKKSSSLENCCGGRYQAAPGSELRGSSLDSAAPRRRASSATPWWNYSMGTSGSHPEGRTTPEIRISPTPPETTHHIHSYGRNKEIGGLTHSHSCLHSRPPGIQRQDPLDETLLPPPYATLLEEENEVEDGAGGVEPVHNKMKPNSENRESRQSQESLLSQDIAVGYNSSQESQDSQFSLRSHRNLSPRFPLQYKRDIKVTYSSNLNQSTSQRHDSCNGSDSTEGMHDTRV